MLPLSPQQQTAYQVIPTCAPLLVDLNQDCSRGEKREDGCADDMYAALAATRNQRDRGAGERDSSVPGDRDTSV